MEPAFDAESGVGFGMIYLPNPAQPLALMSFSASNDVAPVLYTNAFGYWSYETRHYCRGIACLESGGPSQFPPPPGYLRGFYGACGLDESVAWN